MRPEPTLDVTTFNELFSPPVVRTLIDWNRLALLDPPIATVTMTSLDHIGSLFTTWYVGPPGTGEVGFARSSAPPLRVSEAAARVDELDPERVAVLREVNRGLGTGPLLIPLYRIGPSAHLVLDGNHRLVGAHLAGRQIRVLGLAVCGPLDPDLLPDLAFWSEGTDSGAPLP